MKPEGSLPRPQPTANPVAILSQINPFHALLPTTPLQNIHGLYNYK
jgi:hypothetical protein